MAVKVTLFLVAVTSQVLLASSACQGDDCKVEAPQDEVSLMQTKMEGKQRKPSEEQLDAAKEAISEEVEEGKKELRAYVDELSEGEGEEGSSSDEEDDMGACPPGFDMSQPGNSEVATFMDQCLDNIANNQDMSNKAIAQLKECVNGEGNPYSDGNVVTAATKSGDMFSMTMKQASKGGVCNAKPFKVKCEGGKIKPGCANVNLYRVFNTGRNWYSNYWVAKNPTQFGGANNAEKRLNFRKKLAICEDWSNMDKIAVAKLNDKACGKFVWIGNGEPVTNCPNENENFGYSSTLQICICEYPQSNYMTSVRNTDFPK